MHYDDDVMLSCWRHVEDCDVDAVDDEAAFDKIDRNNSQTIALVEFKAALENLAYPGVKDSLRYPGIRELFRVLDNIDEEGKTQSITIKAILM